MTKTQIKELLERAIEPHKICRVFLRYDTFYRYYFPLITGNQLFLGAEEDDFILDGYSIRRFKDVVKAEIRDDKCLEIDTAEGLLDHLIIPDIDITNWQTSLLSLQIMGKNTIIEKESLNENEREFTIGRILN